MSEPTQKKHILLVEDEPAVVKMTKLRLEHEGFDVEVALDGEAALALVKPTTDLILLDIRLPKLDGFEVCKRLKAKPDTAKIPIIVFTASASQWQELTDRCIELGVMDLLKKPFHSKELVEKIRRILWGENPSTPAIAH
ncbi:MAG: response regulator transcription factor [Candidatus Omnitrophica bacterium]|nr:response regulator transcription factor [Candidatus Omnitrophota bacterium]MBI2174503.1 response regulator transcription factor [Candidatus Omnitrophota bacterium]MBI3010076.1 response regulator transcription factor [Candidatus Omnitrophota bacterium]